MKTVPTPIVTWETVVRLSDPMHTPSRQRLRTLRSARTAADGIHVLKRSGGRASGSATYFSAVTALAAAIRQSGDESTAMRLSESGVRIETKYAKLIRNYLQKSSVDELNAAPFYGDLVRETWKALDFAWEDRIDGGLIVGQVKGTKGDLTEIEAEYEGKPSRVDLPASLLNMHHIRQGDSVWILRRLVGSAALLMVLPAVSASEVELSFDEASNDSHETSDVADPVGERLGREYMSNGPGAPISQAEADFFAAIPDDDLPRARVLRLAG